MIATTGDPSVFQDLMDRTQRNLLGFVNVEISLATTFLELAEQEHTFGSGTPRHRSIEIAASAIRGAKRFAARLVAEDLRRQAEERCAELERRISTL